MIVWSWWFPIIAAWLLAIVVLKCNLHKKAAGVFRGAWPQRSGTDGFLKSKTFWGLFCLAYATSLLFYAWLVIPPEWIKHGPGAAAVSEWAWYHWLALTMFAGALSGGLRLLISDKETGEAATKVVWGVVASMLFLAPVVSRIAESYGDWKHSLGEQRIAATPMTAQQLMQPKTVLVAAGGRTPEYPIPVNMHAAVNGTHVTTYTVYQNGSVCAFNAQSCSAGHGDAPIAGFFVTNNDPDRSTYITYWFVRR